MARLSKEEWEDLIAEFHTGQFSRNELAEKYEISHTAVNKKLKGIEPKHKDKVSSLISIKSELAHESFKEVSAVETVVEDKTKHLIYFQNSALRSQEIANKAVGAVESMIKNAKDEDEKNATAISGLSVAKDHAAITKMNKETVLGKDIDTQINISNTNAQQTTNVAELTEEEARKKAEELGVPLSALVN